MLFFNVSAVFDIGYFETIFYKSSDIAIYQYSIIAVLHFFLPSYFPTFLVFNKYFEHQLCSLVTMVMAVSNPDPGLLVAEKTGNESITALICDECDNRACIR